MERRTTAAIASKATKIVASTAPINSRVLSTCWGIMERQNLRPFDRESNRGYYWYISIGLMQHEWEEGKHYELAGIPVIAAPNGSVVELLQWVDGAQVRG